MGFIEELTELMDKYKAEFYASFDGDMEGIYDEKIEIEFISDNKRIIKTIPEQGFNASDLRKLPK